MWDRISETCNQPVRHTPERNMKAKQKLSYRNDLVVHVWQLVTCGVACTRCRDESSAAARADAVQSKWDNQGLQVWGRVVTQGFTLPNGASVTAAPPWCDRCVSLTPPGPRCHFHRGFNPSRGCPVLRRGKGLCGELNETCEGLGASTV